MTDHELAMYDGYATSRNKYWVPAVWAASLVHRARRDGRIRFDIAANHITKVYARTRCGVTFSPVASLPALRHWAPLPSLTGPLARKYLPGFPYS